MTEKDKLLSGIIQSIMDNKPSQVAPLVDKIMAEKVRDIIKEKQKEISERF